jgi:hypothetical protein
MIKKVIFIILTSIICLFAVKRNVLASTICCDGFYCHMVSGSSCWTIVDTGQCGLFETQECDKEETNQCGPGICGSNSNGCCGSSPTWSKSQRYCVEEPNGLNGFELDLVWSSFSGSCSIADKYDPNNNSGLLLRGGTCTCGEVSSPYKACCKSGTLVVPNHYQVDNGPYQDADCPSGSTVLHKGNYGAIDLTWARDACCSPNCNDSGNHCSGQGYTGNCGQNCTGTKGPTCGDAGSHCNGSVYGSSNGCGNCTGTLGSSCGNTNDYCRGQGYASYNGCGSCTGTRVPTLGINGVCGGANGQVYQTPPGSSLCSSPGNVSGVSTNDNNHTYNWTCYGTAGDCAANGSDIACSAIKDTAPIFSSITLYNAGGTKVNPDGSNRNQICENTFGGNKVMKWTVSATDAQGLGDIGTMQLRLNPSNGGTLYTTPAVSSSGGAANFSIDTSGVANGTYNVEVLINDQHTPPGNIGWISTGRIFKVWDCQVPVSGKLYDGSADNTCPTNGFSNLTTTANFTSLSFKDSASGNLIGTNVNSSVNTYNNISGQNFVWGANKTYTAVFNPDIAVDTTMITTRTGSYTQGPCSQQGSITLEQVVDPYVNGVGLTADFSAIVDQEAWFQSMGGGVMTSNKFANIVPVTCKGSCNPKTSTDGVTAGVGSSGVVSYMIGTTSSVDQSTFITGENLVTNKYNYDYFYQQYLVDRGVGFTLSGNQNWSNVSSQVGSTGVVLINGTLTIDSNIVGSNFLMLITKGDIVINQTVDQVNGILLGNNVTAGGKGNKLIINGMVHGVSAVNLIRGFTAKRSNNLSPAVIVNYQPNLLFELPKEVNKRITRWKTN